VENKKPGTLFVVSGPSGAGKSSLIQRFLSKDRSSTFWVSCTTRRPRGAEVDGRDYHFIDVPTFRSMIAAGHFLEWEQVHGNYYGTPGQGLRKVLDNGLDVILDIDVKGALKVKEACPKACLVFVEPPSTEELVRRLSRRGEEEIDRRMKIVEEEMANRRHFQYTIRNNNLENAFGDFRKIITRIRETVYGKNNR
jgi:guanylate kinase